MYKYYENKDLNLLAQVNLDRQIERKGFEDTDIANGNITSKTQQAAAGTLFKEKRAICLLE